MVNHIKVGDKVILRNYSSQEAKVFCYLHDEVPSEEIVVLDRKLLGTEYWNINDLEVLM